MKKQYAATINLLSGCRAMIYIDDRTGKAEDIRIRLELPHESSQFVIEKKGDFFRAEREI